MDRPVGRAIQPRGVCAAIVLAASIGPALAPAATVRVPEDQPTLQAAVAAAASGDVVLLAPGTYTGGAFINNKYLIIESWYRVTGDTSYIAQTVLQGVASNACGGASGCLGNAVLEFGPNAHNSRVIGLTLRGGENGVSAASKVGVTRCHVLDNGDGVDYVAGAAGTIDHSLFALNTDDGIDLNGEMDVTITDNVIRDNLDDGIEFRLYEFIGPLRTITMARNIITGNGEDGIQLIDYPAVSNYVIRIERNLFVGNYDGSGSSAAIGCMPNGNTVENLVGTPMAERVYVIHNTFMGEKNGLVGGANTIALDNIFTGIQGSAVRRVGGGSVTAFSLFWNNGIHHEASVVDAPTLRFADPLLDAAGHLTAGSPAINAGVQVYTWNGELVMNEPMGAPSDLGAFEFLPNRPPVVDAGPDRIASPGTPLRLSAAVSDDGQPVPEGMLTFQWSVVSGPGAVTFDAPQQPSTGASFAAVGSYVVQLSASDGLLSASDSVQVMVQVMTAVADYPVLAGSDDAEEDATGTISANVTDIEMVQDATVQVVGLRFPGVAVAQGTRIRQAYIQFEADEVQTMVTSLIVRGQAADHADPFALTTRNVSNRPRTAASVTWAPGPWMVIGRAGPAERTPDLSGVIQEIVNRPGWARGHAIAIIISGVGRRTARSFEGEPAGAAFLHIETDPVTVGVGEHPPPTGLALRALGSPARGAVEVEFRITPGQAATLELLDVSGRRVAGRTVVAGADGAERLVLARGLPPGVFLVRLAQNGDARVVKAMVLE